MGLARPVAACVASVAVVAAAPAWAVEPFVLKDIRIEGLQRTDPGTVFASLPFRVGDTYDDAKGATALRALFATGLFNDVRLEIDGDVVIVVVEERPVIAAVSFVGMKEFESDTISKALRDAGIGEGLPFDKALVDRAEQEIKRQYLSRSLYGAEVVTTVTPLERNRVNVTFTVVEGDAARIGEIRIVGNAVFSERTLLGLFEQTTSGWLTWYTKSDRYSRAKLNADLETLRAYYTNRGYLDFAVESAQVTISPDKQHIAITISVREGQRFVVTGVRLEGEYLGRLDEFKSLVRVEPGAPYRAQDVADTVRLFGERFGLYGYAFARVEPNPVIDRERGQVEVVFVALPQRRVYVRRINVAGNLRTRDEVIRREFRQFESAWYDGARIKLSRDRVDRLGFFTEVSVDTEEVPGAPDQVDLTLKVTEKPTGNLLLGAGYSSAEKLSLTASVRQENIFGTGNYLGVELNTSKYNRSFVLSSVDPYFTVDGVSRYLDLYYRTTRPINSQGDTYSLVTPGVVVRFGVPFSDFDTVFFGLGVESTRIKGSTGLPNNWYLYREEYGDTATAFPLTLGWARDGRDSALVPTRGRYSRVNLEWGVGGNAQYARANLQLQQYIPLGGAYTLGLNGEIGYGRSLNDRTYPFFKNYFGGGLGSVRAFDQASLGPVDVTGTYIGGPKRVNLNAELYVPVPGSGTDKTLRLFAFTDVGNVWGEDEKVSAGSLRASAGIGLSWLSPIGPLKLSYGTPIRKEPNDRIQKFQFQVGTAF
ncbi:outer membrane protein assembly factor BamA [Azohydromonas sp.]|uniref:outer membrane protein assembly factor BamA n=1 Tax=Azohydromonas sp. TaxID=1872666 RepID=UPI002CA8E01A|nr:outer membrane protein assembly factor BamA [Azohydromonas sp.]HMM85120.1 outer membrane protein assembly factor BamA [Azohydromonas sp.]